MYQVALVEKLSAGGVCKTISFVHSSLLGLEVDQKD